MAILLSLLTAFLSAALASVGPVLAEEGEPANWQIGFQKAATPIMEQITSFHSYVTAIIVAIALFVMVLLVMVMVRFNEKSNPQPSRTAHNTPLEVAWTVIPILILVAIAIPSFRLLFAQYDYPEADLTVTATGSQWYWTYEYPDQGISFDSILVQDANLKPGQPRLLSVDHELVVPVNKNVIVQVKANDVIHDWAVPSFGVKLDAVPGRLQRAWFRAEHTGTYRGQCSELCGRNHAFMPIVVRVVSDEAFAKWLEENKPKKSANKDKPGQVASARN
jgi:cytochrome c oxidase subunit 2